MKTMRRYEDLNLKIESFRLGMNWLGMVNYSVADELIVKAMKMGATDLNFELPSDTNFYLPDEVLGSETLTSLSLLNGRIDLGTDGKVNCPKLKSLSLSRVYFEGDIIWDIISSCPSIEKLVLSNCNCLFRNKIITEFLTLSPIELGKQNVGSGVDGPINLYEFHKLKCLFLGNVIIDRLFFSDCSSKFPCLKDLTLRNCDCYKGLLISSHSLECISFWQGCILRAEFDVPRIHKFCFSGPYLPTVSFETASREWESDISIMPSYLPATLFFVKLKKLLTKLSLSKISLSLNNGSGYGYAFDKSFDCEGDFKGLPKPVVENLMMDAPSSACSDLLDGLFWSCCPKFITGYWFPKSCIELKANNIFLEFLCKRLIQQACQDCCFPNRSMFGQSDLEEVNVELFEETVPEWQPLPWKTLLDASKSPKDRRKIRFQLRWGLESIILR